MSPGLRIPRSLPRVPAKCHVQACIRSSAPEISSSIPALSLCTLPLQVGGLIRNDDVMPELQRHRRPPRHGGARYRCAVEDARAVSPPASWGHEFPLPLGKWSPERIHAKRQRHAGRLIGRDSDPGGWRFSTSCGGFQAARSYGKGGDGWQNRRDQRKCPVSPAHHQRMREIE